MRFPPLLDVLSMVAGCVPTTEVQVHPVKLSASQMQMVQQQVVYNFKDIATPQSRNIKPYRVANGDIAVCGEENGKNSFGAHISYKRFYIRSNGATAKKTYVDDSNGLFASAACERAQAGQLPIATSEL